MAVDAENQTGSSADVEDATNCWAISPVPKPWILTGSQDSAQRQSELIEDEEKKRVFLNSGPLGTPLSLDSDTDIEIW